MHPQTQNTPKIKISEDILINKTTELLQSPCIISNYTLELYKIISEYCNKSPEFEKRSLKTNKGEKPFSLQKGIFLISSPGTGKTFIFEQLLPSFFPKLRRASVYDLQSWYTKFGYDAFEESQKHIHITRDKHKDNYNIYIDDFGRESKSCKNYGNEIPFMDHVIEYRTRMMQKYGSITHGSSNLNLANLKEYYTGPTFSRMFKLFNFVIINSEGIDYRMI